MPKQRPVPEESLDAIVAILELVRRGRAHSRSEIIERTGLSRAVVTQRVNELLTRGFLAESVAASTGGRPPRQLEFRADAGHVLVADIGATSIDVAAADATGNILAQLAETADVASGPEVVLGRVEALFDRLLEEHDAGGELWGLGIGVPGPVEFRTGHPISPPIMPGWEGYPVREYFSDRHGVPAWVDNDVNIMALGEWRAGIAQGHRNFIFVKVGTGIGSGIVSDGLMHRGAQGSAGDIGHIQALGDTDEVCRCGKVGCLEALAGGAAIAREGRALARAGASERLGSILDDRGEVTAREVIRAARVGDAAALELLNRSATLVGQTLAGLANFFNPSLIVIGGGVARAGDAYLATIRQVIYARSTALATRELLVQLSRTGGRAGVIGAASMVLDQLFSEQQLGQWIDHGRPAVTSTAAA
ncbi:MAG: ROK family transcriptional regulator [Chloroflexota bacterium]|nr:ROK family transcriptional regulator [Chloroflexota bacterium]